MGLFGFGDTALSGSDLRGGGDRALAAVVVTALSRIGPGDMARLGSDLAGGGDIGRLESDVVGTERAGGGESARSVFEGERARSLVGPGDKARPRGSSLGRVGGGLEGGLSICAGSAFGGRAGGALGAVPSFGRDGGARSGGLSSFSKISGFSGFSGGFFSDGEVWRKLPEVFSDSGFLMGSDLEVSVFLHRM